MPTLSKQDDGLLSVGNARAVVFEYAGPLSYVTDGDSITADNCGLKVLQALVPCGNPSNGSAVRLVEWDRTNNKLVWYVPNTGAEVTGATDLSAFTVRLVAIGK